jgi:hypothetical protein
MFDTLRHWIFSFFSKNPYDEMKEFKNKRKVIPIYNGVYAIDLMGDFIFIEENKK